MERIAIYAAVAILAGSFAFGQDEPPQAVAPRCQDMADARTATPGYDWIALTPDQWQFVRGVFVLDPVTPPGMPYGDKVALLLKKGDPVAYIVFIDGERACTPMAAPLELVEMIETLDTIRHEGDGT